MYVPLTKTQVNISFIETHLLTLCLLDVVYLQFAGLYLQNHYRYLTHTPTQITFKKHRM